MKRIYTISQEAPFKGRMVMVEGYDISIARYLVSGVDVWLNTPRRPFEASGTSGMKVTMNGGINFSVLDGWWCEAAQEDVNGWSIGDERDFDDEDRLAEQDSLSLYQSLEQLIIPKYYARNSQGIPDEWIRVSKGSIKTIPPQFNTDRMVGEYARRFYFPAIAKGRRLVENGHQLARDLGAWKASMQANWPSVRVGWKEEVAASRQVSFGEKVNVSARVTLGDIAPTDVLVEAYIVDLGEDGSGRSVSRVPLKQGKGGDGSYCFSGTFLPPDSGTYTITVRATPYHPEMIHPHELGLIRWLSGAGEGAGDTTTVHAGVSAEKG